MHNLVHRLNKKPLPPILVSRDILQGEDLTTFSLLRILFKTSKKRIFFAFFLIENHRDILEDGRGNKKCLFIIYTHFLFSQLKIFSLKIFQNGHQTQKHGKLKSKKKIFTNFQFLLHEALLDV